jgi:hypothetical protein
MALKLPIPKQFDDAKLATMIEPFVVRVEKLNAGRRQPIPLPESEESPAGSGVNYDKDAVRGLEQFLVTEWSGGGYYEIKITDAQGQVLQWSPSWDPQTFPEKVPPPLQGAINSNPTPPATKRNQMPAFPNGFPSFQQMQQPYGAGFQQPQFQQPYYPPMPPPPMVGTPQYALWSAEAKDRSESAELRALREENQRREREAIEARHKAELERDRQATEARFNAQTNAMSELRTLITSLATAIQANANNKPNNELEAMRLQLQASEAKAEADRREREQERRERETRDMMKSMGDASQKQIEAMTRQLDAFQASLTSINANRQDPMIEMLREQARQSAEMVKAISQSHASAIDKMQANAMHPRDILQVAREASTQADQVTDKLTTSFGRVIDLQAKVTENALSLQPQGSPVVDMVRDGAAHIKDMAERYLGKAELAAKLQASQQENLLNAQRDVQIAQIQAQNPGLAGYAQPQIVDGGNNGHVNHQTPKPPKKKIKAVVDATGQPVKVRKILGKTDAEWFGPIEDDINRLRAGVAEFLESIKVDPPRLDKEGEIQGLAPEHTAQMIAQGTQMVIQVGASIPAMQLLLFEQRFPDFMDVVLPDAPEQYRTDVINILVPLLRGEVGGGQGMTGEPKADAEEASSDGDDDESNGDDDDDGAPDDEADADPDDGKNAPKDPPVETKASVPPVLRTVGPNGKSLNPPRRT